MTQFAKLRPRNAVLSTTRKGCLCYTLKGVNTYQNLGKAPKASKNSCDKHKRLWSLNNNEAMEVLSICFQHIQRKMKLIFGGRKGYSTFLFQLMEENEGCQN